MLVVLALSAILFAAWLHGWLRPRIAAAAVVDGQSHIAVGCQHPGDVDGVAIGEKARVKTDHHFFGINVFASREAVVPGAGIDRVGDGLRDLPQVIEGAIEESRRQYGYNARFWYPKQGGIASLTDALNEQIKNIETGCEVKAIDLEQKEIELISGQKEKYDFV
jgi:hypothetical protein